MSISFQSCSCVLAVFAAVTLARVAPAAELSKANRLLIKHGLQIQGMATKDDVFHLQTYRDANYTAINWLFEADTSKHGAAPGFVWARWVGDESQMPPRAGHNEEPYMNSLVAMSLGDEKNLNDPAVREPYIKWFNNVTPRYPNAIIYANNYGGQVSDAALSDFIARAKPDMIAFDTYPYRSNYTTKKPEPPIGGSPTEWYNELRRYRAHARAAGIPFATYRQSFHAEQDYDQKVYRDPSRSEFRLNTFGALAFNCKFLIDFTYNTGASSFFTKPGGDTNKTLLYDELRQVNTEARNLGRALVYLKPIDEATDKFDTSILFIRGRNESGPNAIPVGFVPDGASPDGYTDWESNRNDPYLRGWEVKNLGQTNGGRPGDVIISWFTQVGGQLDEVYLMVTNGLCDVTGDGAATRQRITLNFDDQPATQTIELLNRNTGKVDPVKLPLVKTRRQLVLEIEGGTAELLKFKTGAPFVGVATR